MQINQKLIQSVACILITLCFHSFSNETKTGYLGINYGIGHQYNNVGIIGELKISKYLMAGAEISLIHTLEIDWGPGHKSPKKQEFIEPNILIGTGIAKNIFYARVNSGIGYQNGVIRGKYINTITDDYGNLEVENYERVKVNSVCIPIQISFGILKYVGAGIKFKSAIGQESYSAINLEIMLGKL